MNMDSNYTDQNLHNDKKPYITHLPVEILQSEIQSYLLCDQYRLLMNTSILHFRDIKKTTICVRMPHRVTSHFWEDEKVQKSVLEKIVNCSKQLTFEFEGYSLKALLNNGNFKEKLLWMGNISLRLYDGSLAFLDLLPNLHTLKIDSYKGIIDTKRFVKVKHLVLTSCENVTGISSLKFLVSLTLKWCSALEHIEGLRGIHFVCIQGCIRLRDISGLGQHKRLVIDDCSCLTDLCSLNQIDSLVIRNCRQLAKLPKLVDVKTFKFEMERATVTNISELEMLGSNPKLSLIAWLCDRMDISKLQHLLVSAYLTGGLHSDLSCLANVRSLKLINFPNLVDISYLGHVKCLTLNSCGAITTLTGLGQPGQREVALKYLHGITDFSPVKSVQKLTVSCCNGFNDQQDISGVCELVLSCYSSISALRFSRCLESFTLEDYTFTDEFPLSISSQVKYLILNRCAFKRVEGRGAVEKVRLLNCSQLVTVEAFRDVQDVTLIYCRGLRSIRCLHKVERLSVTRYKIDPPLDGFGEMKNLISIWKSS